jgi:hypothetical protein
MMRERVCFFIARRFARIVGDLYLIGDRASLEKNRWSCASCSRARIGCDKENMPKERDGLGRKAVLMYPALLPTPEPHKAA